MSKKHDSRTFSLKKFTTKLLIASAILYVLLCVVFFAIQPLVLYQPSYEIHRTPNNISLDFKNVTLASGQADNISAWYVPARNERGTVLFCHGNAGNMADRLYSIQQFHKLGLSVLIFDYNGYGLSSGKPSEENTYQNALAGWEYLTKEREISPGRIVLFGRSLGGAVAVWLAEQVNAKALIIESTFTSVPDTGKHYFPFSPVRALCRYDYNSLRRIKKIRLPILVIHSRNDDVIPYAHGRTLYEAAPEPKQFLELKGNHNEGFAVTGDRYVSQIDAFLKTYLDN